MPSVPLQDREAQVAGGTLVLTRRDVAELLSLDVCIAAVERAFRSYGEGNAAPPSVLGIHVEGGGFHIKAGVLTLDRPYFAAKSNANFPGNPGRGLPTVQGVVVLADAGTGEPLAVMDSAEITALRTAAATAVAAKYLARSGSRVATIVGCGVQGYVQLSAIDHVLDLEMAYVHDADAARADRLAAELGEQLDLAIRPVNDYRRHARESDVIVTCTSAVRPVLALADVSRGAFVAGVGADNPQKHELAPDLLAGALVVPDLLEQAAAMGDLHHALVAGAMTLADAGPELGAIVAGRAPGRTSRDQIIVFDSTGMALQDVAVAAAVHQAARERRRGVVVDLHD